MSDRNLRVTMKRHPQGSPTEADFEIAEADLPELQEGQALVKVQYLSLDPYMRPMMDPVRSYVPHLNPGDLMPGATVGAVVESKEPALPVGTIVQGALGWQQYGVITKDVARIVNPDDGPISTSLHVLGLTGATAHFGLLEKATVAPGDTVLVTAASGGVGSVVGQIAKLKGARVVGVAGGPEKCAYVRDELGFDACVDYKAADFVNQLEAATPDLVNVVFENVGGPVFDAVLARTADFARIALCGNVSQYNAEKPYGLTGLRYVLMHRLTIYGFVMADHRPYFPQAISEIGQWIREGKVTYREDIEEGGLEKAPEAFLRMLTGKNFGKTLVKVS